MKRTIQFIFLIGLFSLLSASPVFSQGCVEATSDDGPQLVGYIQPEFGYYFYGKDANDNPVKPSSFYFRRARIGVTGKVLDDFRYYFMLETSPFIGGVGSAFLMDAFVAWEKFNWARIAVGSFKQPFGREVTTACYALTTIDRAIVSDQLVSPQRDYGPVHTQQWPTSP